MDDNTTTDDHSAPATIATLPTDPAEEAPGPDLMEAFSHQLLLNDNNNNSGFDANEFFWSVAAGEEEERKEFTNSLFRAAGHASLRRKGERSRANVDGFFNSGVSTTTTPAAVEGGDIPQIQVDTILPISSPPLSSPTEEMPASSTKKIGNVSPKPGRSLMGTLSRSPKRLNFVEGWIDSMDSGSPKDPLSLEGILNVQLGINLFTQHCMQENLGSRISFWLHVEQFKLPQNTPDVTVKYLHAIYKRYFSNEVNKGTGVHSIPLPNSVLDNIKESYSIYEATSQVDIQMFDNAQKLVAIRLNDHIPIFLKTRLGQEYFDEYVGPSTLLPSPNSTSSLTAGMSASVKKFFSLAKKATTNTTVTLSPGMASPSSTTPENQSTSPASLNAITTIRDKLSPSEYFEQWQQDHPLYSVHHDRTVENFLEEARYFCANLDILNKFQDLISEKDYKGSQCKDRCTLEFREFRGTTEASEVLFSENTMEMANEEIVESGSVEPTKSKTGGMYILLSKLYWSPSFGNTPIPSEIVVRIRILCGHQSLLSNPDKLESAPVPFRDFQAVWEIPASFSTGVQFNNFPKRARIAILLYGKYEDGSERLLAWTQNMLVDQHDIIQTGWSHCRLWVHSDTSPTADPAQWCGTVGNSPFHDAPEITIFIGPDSKSTSYVQPKFSSGEFAMEMLQNPFMKPDPLPSDFNVEHLPTMLANLPYHIASTTLLVNRQLQTIFLDTGNVHIALALLSHNFVDEHVRRFAVCYLDRCSDEELLEYIGALVHAIKNEPYLDSPIMRFLIIRSLRDIQILRSIFWQIRTELSNSDEPWYFARYYLLLEALLRYSPIETLQELFEQLNLIREYSLIASLISDIKPGTGSSLFQLLLSKVRYPKNIVFPLNCSQRLLALAPGQCKVFGSKKKPIMICFKKGPPHPPNHLFKIIFKSGDDLRQDMIILRMIDLMNKLFNENGLDLKMIVYECVSTSIGEGFIEVVSDAATLANIQMKQGSMGALRDNALLSWLQEHNQTAVSMSAAVNNFITSCAGFLVATYVLGVGDRHNDNIMLSTDGRLFHIDYGHFLGNVKSFLGVKRERTPFILTSDFVKVMEYGTDSTNSNFLQFVRYTIAAFQIVRRNSSKFINLLSMLIAARLPELKSDVDIDYVRNALFLDRSEEEAIDSFQLLIVETLKSEWSTKLNWYVHNLKHYNFSFFPSTR